MAETSPSPGSADVAGQQLSTRCVWARPWVVLLGFLLVGFAIYAPALDGELVWDDHYLVGENPFFRSPVFAAEVFQHHLFFESFSTYYRPVQNLSYMADYWLWGGSPAGYHVTNALLHVVAAWLLLLLLLRLLPGLLANARLCAGTALLVSLAWLVHPVHNAAVAYISGRADSLAALLALAAWLLWMKSCEVKNAFAIAGTATCASLALLAALCSKEIALVWLALFGVHVNFFQRGISRLRRFSSLAGVGGVLAIYAILHSWPEARAAAEGDAHEPLAGRVVLMFRALGDYTGLMLIPARLMMERSLGPATHADRGGWWQHISSEYLSILGAASLVGAVWLCLQRGEGMPLRRFGALWFAIAFVPISNLIPLNAEVAEHWIYLASIGFLLLLAGTVAMLPRVALRRVSIALGCAIALLAVRTSFRAADWADPETFARKTIANGGGTPRMLAYLAQELGIQGRLTEQEQVYRKALAMYPDFTTARINLGLCLQKQGRAGEAGALLDLGPATAVPRTMPRTWNAALNLAGQHHKEGRRIEALALIREWRAQFPETWELCAFEATILRDLGANRDAIAVALEYARSHWWHLPSQLGTATLQRDAGDYEAALAMARRAQRLDVHGAAAFDEAARSELALGRLAAALESEAIAIARAPRNSEYLDLFSAILHGLGRDHEALAVRRKAALIAAESGRTLL